VEEFLNAVDIEPSDSEIAIAQAIREEAHGGESQATLAARYSVSRQLVSAILREKRLVPPESSAAAPFGGVVATVGAAEAWFRVRGLLPEHVSLTEDDLQRLLELKSLLLASAFQNNGGAVDTSVGEGLERLARDATLVVRFAGPGAPSLTPADAGPGAPLGFVLATVYEAMREGTWQRMKACPADHCAAVFYDASRNRTATWCSMQICGNRTKVRNYQARRRA